MTTPTDGTLLALGGTLPSPELLRKLRRAHAILIAADGAAARLLDDGVAPDLVVGDLDSLSAGDAGRLRALGVSVLEMPDQELNDFEKALRQIISGGGAAATVIGIAGGMIDHTLNNFSVLAKYATRLRLRLCDDHSIGYVVHDELMLDATPGDRISLIPLPAATLSTSGLAWELRRELLAIGVREGASNKAVSDSIQVRVHDGIVAVFRYL